MRHTPFSAKHLDATGKLLASVGGSLGYVATEVLNQKSPGKLGDRWSIGWGYLFLADHPWYDRMLITCCRITTSVLLCGSTPFREDSMTEVIGQTTDDGGEGEIPR